MTDNQVIIYLTLLVIVAMPIKIWLERSFEKIM